MVDCHRIAYLLLAYHYGFWMQFLAMTIYIRVAETLPLSFYLLVLSFQFVCGAGIIFNTREILGCFTTVTWLPVLW